MTEITTRTLASIDVLTPKFEAIEPTMSKFISLAIGLLTVISIAPNSEAMSANSQPSLQQPAENLHSQTIFRNRERDNRREEWLQRREERRQRNRDYWAKPTLRERYNRDYRYNYDYRYNRDGRYNRDYRYNRDGRYRRDSRYYRNNY